MAEVMLIGNPRRRKRKSKKSSVRRRRRSAPRAVRRRRRRAAASTTVRRRRRRSSVARYIGKVRRRRRSNPSLRGITSGALPTLKAGFTGALGALGLDFIWGYGKGYLPVSVAASPLAQYATKLIGALLIGIIGNKVLRGKGGAMAVGAATVVLHDALKAQVQSSFPSIPLGEYLSIAPTVGTMDRAGPLLSTGMGEYLGGLPNNGGGGVNDDMAYTGEWNGDGMNG